MNLFSLLVILTYLDNVLPVTSEPVLLSLSLAKELVTSSCSEKKRPEVISVPPLCLIVSILSGIPKQLISALNPLCVPFALVRYGRLW